ncbi:hypothetical protein WDU94_010425 [Cyamophila willieti]
MNSTQTEILRAVARRPDKMADFLYVKYICLCIERWRVSGAHVCFLTLLSVCANVTEPLKVSASSHFEY